MNIIKSLGLMFFILGLTLLAIKAMSGEYVDAEGFLHEKFFLLPLGFLSLGLGIMSFFVFLLHKVFQKIKH